MVPAKLIPIGIFFKKLKWYQIITFALAVLCGVAGSIGIFIYDCYWASLVPYFQFGDTDAAYAVWVCVICSIVFAGALIVSFVVGAVTYLLCSIECIWKIATGTCGLWLLGMFITQFILIGYTGDGKCKEIYGTLWPKALKDEGMRNWFLDQVGKKASVVEILKWLGEQVDVTCYKSNDVTIALTIISLGAVVFSAVTWALIKWL